MGLTTFSRNRCSRSNAMASLLAKSVASLSAVDLENVSKITSPGLETASIRQPNVSIELAPRREPED